MKVLEPPKAKRVNFCDEFIFTPPYTNSLPDLPYAGKFLKCNMRSLVDRFADYRPIKLDARKRTTMCDLDVGADIDLVDPKAYQATEGENQPEMNEKDAYLLEDESQEYLLKSRRSAQHRASVPFMRRTEYISSEFNKLGTGADRQETRIGYNLLKRKNSMDDMFYRDRDAQLAAINKTFEDVKKPATKHHSKPGVTAVEECYVFPDFEMLKYTCIDVIFDTDPSYSEVPPELQQDCLKYSQLVAMDNGDNTACLFCPTVETIEKMKSIEEQEDVDENVAYDYNLNREYNWQIRDTRGSVVDDEYALYQRGDTFYYCPLQAHVKLTRKRLAAGEHKKLASLKVTHRKWTEEEEAAMERQQKRLLSGSDSDEEMVEDEEDDKEKEEEEAMDTEERVESTPSPNSSSTTRDSD